MLPRLTHSALFCLHVWAYIIACVLLYSALRRKVAVPVPDGYTWAEFIQQVKSKLRISGVKEVYLASVSRTPHKSVAATAGGARFHGCSA